MQTCGPDKDFLLKYRLTYIRTDKQTDGRAKEDYLLPLPAHTSFTYLCSWRLTSCFLWQTFCRSDSHLQKLLLKSYNLSYHQPLRVWTFPVQPFSFWWTLFSVCNHFSYLIFNANFQMWSNQWSWVLLLAIKVNSVLSSNRHNVSYSDVMICWCTTLVTSIGCVADNECNILVNIICH